MDNRIIRRLSFNWLFSIALAVVLVGAMAAAVAAKPAAAGRTYVAGDCAGAAFKPREVVLTCGDAGLVATKMKWGQWSSSRAHGIGVGEEKVCTPNCAEGRVAKGPMQLSLSRPRTCSQDGKRHFTKIRYAWPDGAPGSGPKQGTIPLPCSILSS